MRCMTLSEKKKDGFKDWNACCSFSQDSAQYNVRHCSISLKQKPIDGIISIVWPKSISLNDLEQALGVFLQHEKGFSKLGETVAKT